MTWIVHRAIVDGIVNQFVSGSHARIIEQVRQHYIQNKTLKLLLNGVY